MGDRANVQIHCKDGDMYFYTHWQGYKTPETLQRGIRRVLDAGRQTDESYATRLLFQEWTRGYEDDDLSFGLQLFESADREHPMLIVDFPKQCIRRHSKPYGWAAEENQLPEKRWTFEEFATLGEDIYDITMQ